MKNEYIYKVLLNKEESALLKQKYISRRNLAKSLWEGAERIFEHRVTATIDSSLNDDYIYLKATSDSLDGLLLGIEYLKEFIQ